MNHAVLHIYDRDLYSAYIYILNYLLHYFKSVLVYTLNILANNVYLQDINFITHIVSSFPGQYSKVPYIFLDFTVNLSDCRSHLHNPTMNREKLCCCWHNRVERTLNTEASLPYVL
jgi:hypothetical protein